MKSDMRGHVTPEIQATFDLLLAEDWLAKCDLVARERALLPAVRAILRDEARNARERGDVEDALVFAAHVALLDDIERNGLGSVQAEIIRAMAWAS